MFSKIHNYLHNKLETIDDDNDKLLYINKISKTEDLYYGNISKIPFKIWSKNRKVDKKRVNELR
jgi:hypothetical protein